MGAYTYTKEMACAICETRRPRRFCPGVRGDICPVCCGTEREVTVDCPLDCEYLIEARKHDKPIPLTGADLPNRDIQVSEKLLRENELLLTYLCNGLLRAAMEMPGVVDLDVREALESLIRTYRTLQSGVYYESRPANPLAHAVYDGIQHAATEYREEEKKQLGMTRTRDADVLAMLVFLQHFELDRNNGRKRGRAFIQTLGNFYVDMLPSAEPEAGSSLVLP
jgi:hypothetical protein